MVVEVGVAEAEVDPVVGVDVVVLVEAAEVGVVLVEAEEVGVALEEAAEVEDSGAEEVAFEDLYEVTTCIYYTI